MNSCPTNRRYQKFVMGRAGLVSHPIGILPENIRVPWATGVSESSKLISLVRQFPVSSSEYLMILLPGYGQHRPRDYEKRQYHSSEAVCFQISD